MIVLEKLGNGNAGYGFYLLGYGGHCIAEVSFAVS